MKIGIDYTAAVRQGGGIGRYTRNLVRALARIDRHHEYQLIVAGAGYHRRHMGSWPSNFTLRVLPLSDRWLHIFWQRLRLPIPVQVVTGRLDLYHSPDFVLPPTAGTPAILTVHDLSFLQVPQYFVPEFRRYLRRAVARAVRKARLVLADSQSTRKDLLELLGVAPERVSVLLPGVESRFRRVLDQRVLSATRQRYGLPGRFILGLGTLQPRKNFEGLVEAFSLLVRSNGSAPESNDMHLVIAGGKGWMHDEVLRAVERSGLERRIRLCGFVQDDDLPALYSLAEIFAFPSWYEGFGLPVLEAMACGTPVVAADNSSLPEVVGDAGILVPAGEPAALAEALSAVLGDTGLRGDLEAAGLDRVRRFTWESAAQQLLREYESVTDNGLSHSHRICGSE